MRDLYQKITHTLKEVVEEKEGRSLLLSQPLWEIPKEEKFGDFSSMVALKLASLKKQSALSIAEELREILQDKLGEEIEKIEVISPGFINLFFSSRALWKALKRLLEERENFFKIKRERSVLIEFVSANPTGPLSIAHGRQAVVGDVLANVFEFFGNKVEREYYINDEGSQIDLLIQTVQARIKEIKGEKFIFPEGGYKGEYLKEVAYQIEEKHPSDIRKFTLNYMLELIKKDLNALQVKFTHWVSQKELIESGRVEEVINMLREKRLVYEKEGAIWFASTLWADQKDRVLKKSNKKFTYFASDIAYHHDKLSRGFDKLINLWGPDHHGYIPRVKSAVKALGAEDDTLEVVIVQIVKLKSKEKMSKRKGNIILLSDLIKKVGKDAARFYYLTRRNSTPLEFDIDLAVKSSFDNPLYYIQYAHARICSIFRKGGKKNLEVKRDVCLSEEEMLLLRKLFQFAYCLDKVYYNLEPVFIVEFLKSLATSFHRFYENVQVLCEDKLIKNQRLALCEAVRIVLACGLNLLGISVPERMGKNR